MRGVVPEALVSRKVVYREVCTEGSETAKSGTDEQKRDMRHCCSGKQAHLCEAQNEREQPCRFRSDWMKEKAFTGGGLFAHEMSRREVSRGHSICLMAKKD